ncbi:SCO2525 family SAM-dependent methyltransferase [Longispora sp. K20-0274]|uniref:SCO2525 family SAM-dependent methyltransferase n=1 Tax=Longispora sp. K20-0274 TaxID=3088255 RepID=UPI00399A8D2B
MDWPDAATWPPEAEAGSNADYPWQLFRSAAYRRHNYKRMVDDDQQILKLVGEFFNAQAAGGVRRRGIDIGAGANLYPALAMLPLCATITLLDVSITNVNWLRAEVRKYGRSWNQFWNVLRQHDLYRKFSHNPRRALADRAVVRQGDIFTMPVTEQWEIGTMFFVAESISQLGQQFADATGAFLRCLKPGSPFAAAFMAGSEGYEVEQQQFPAVPVDTEHVAAALQQHGVVDLSVYRIGIHQQLRPGYNGMILAMGRVRG